MGMFDEIRVRVSLPVELPVDHRDHWFQTKSLGCHLEYYEITADGLLFLIQHPGFRKPVAYTGEVRFYSQASGIGKDEEFNESGWLECSAYFVAGKMQSINLIQYREAVK